MALVDRLMGLAADGVTPDRTRKIGVHTFFAANHQRIDGGLTRQEVIDMFTMDADDITEYDALAATAPTGTTPLATALKSLFIEKIHAIFLLAEEGMPGYTTPALVRAKLGI